MEFGSFGKRSLPLGRLPEFPGEVVPRELADRFESAIFMAEDEGRVGDAIEEGGLHHCVLSHVLKDEAIAGVERVREGEVANGISGETGIAAQPVGMFTSYWS